MKYVKILHRYYDDKNIFFFGMIFVIIISSLPLMISFDNLKANSLNFLLEEHLLGVIILTIIMLFLMSVFIFLLSSYLFYHKKFYDLIKYNELFQFIEDNEGFSPISIEKIKNYDFKKDRHKIQLFLLEKNIPEMIKVLDIWDIRTLIINKQEYTVATEEYNNWNKMREILKEIEYILQEYQNIKQIEFNPKNSEAITLADLNDYYVKVAKSSLPM